MKGTRNTNIRSLILARPENSNQVLLTYILNKTTNSKKTNVLISPTCQDKKTNANKPGRGSQIGKVKKIVNLFMVNVPIYSRKTTENLWFCVKDSPLEHWAHYPKMLGALSRNGSSDIIRSLKKSTAYKKRAWLNWNSIGNININNWKPNVCKQEKLT